MLEKEQPFKSPDLIMSIKATSEQMTDFGIEIQGSKIIFKGKSGTMEDDTGTFSISDALFDFSKDVDDKYKLLYKPRGDGGIAMSVDNTSNSRNFPDVIHVSLSYFTSKTKPRTNIGGEYRVGDYFELVITNKDGSKMTYNLERDRMIHPID